MEDSAVGHITVTSVLRLDLHSSRSCRWCVTFYRIRAVFADTYSFPPCNSQHTIPKSGGEYVFTLCTGLSGLCPGADKMARLGRLAALSGLPTTTPTKGSPRATPSSWRVSRHSTTRTGSVNKRRRTGSSSGPSPEEARSTLVARSRLRTPSFGTHAGVPYSYSHLCD